MKKTIGDYKEIVKRLSVKDFDQVKRGVVLNHVRNIERMIVNRLPVGHILPKETEGHLRELEALAKE